MSVVAKGSGKTGQDETQNCQRSGLLGPAGTPDRSVVGKVTRPGTAVSYKGL